jgi:hypothetical protein
MPTLQIRELPDDVYDAVVAAASSAACPNRPSSSCAGRWAWQARIGGSRC